MFQWHAWKLADNLIIPRKALLRNNEKPNPCETSLSWVTSNMHYTLPHWIEKKNVVPKKTDKTNRIKAGGENVLRDPTVVELGTEKICPGATCELFKGKFSNSADKVTEVECKEFMVSITTKQKLLTLLMLDKLNQYGIIANKYTISELLKIQSSPTLSYQKKYMKSALACMATFKYLLFFNSDNTHTYNHI